MGFLKDLLIKLGWMEKPKLVRKGDRRRRNRRYERVTEYKNSPEYKSRMKRDRRKAEQRKT
ncbi:MAG TPA: hypothetical protein VK791_02915 [bacterium]|jgi:hypothetical protein|nr:hypothetical protein [bacterium]